MTGLAKDQPPESYSIDNAKIQPYDFGTVKI